MNVQAIGENAGKVWGVLNANGKSLVKDIKKATKLTDKEVYSALGWLAKEGKVNIEVEGKDIAAELV